MAEEETNSQEPSAEQQYDICPCCGKPTLKRPVKPSQMLMDHWMACMISGTPFTHTYPLFNGRVEITVGIMSSETEGKLSLLTSLLDLAFKWMESSPDKPVNMPQVKAMARMCSVIHKIRLKASANDWREFLPIDALDIAIKKLLPLRETLMEDKEPIGIADILMDIQTLLTAPTTISSLPMDLLATTTEAHMQLNNILMNAGFDENFWSGIELG